LFHQDCERKGTVLSSPQSGVESPVGSESSMRRNFANSLAVIEGLFGVCGAPVFPPETCQHEASAAQQSHHAKRSVVGNYSRKFLLAEYQHYATNQDPYESGSAGSYRGENFPRGNVMGSSQALRGSDVLLPLQHFMFPLLTSLPVLAHSQKSLTSGGLSVHVTFGERPARLEGPIHGPEAVEDSDRPPEYRIALPLA
jgi:hypothetical protein